MSRLHRAVALDDAPATDDPATGTSTTVPTPGPTPTPSGPRVAADIDPASVPTGQARDFGPAPEVSTGDLAPNVAEAIEHLMGFLVEEEIFTVDLHFGPAVLAEEDLVAGLHIERTDRAVLEDLALADKVIPNGLV